MVALDRTQSNGFAHPGNAFHAVVNVRKVGEAETLSDAKPLQTCSRPTVLRVLASAVLTFNL